MIITVLKEPSYENRVAITPQATQKYISQGFKVIIEANAGINSGFDDAAYISSGAKIEKNISKILRQSDLVTYKKQGKNVYYSLADDHVRDIIEKALEHIKE